MPFSGNTQRFKSNLLGYYGKQNNHSVFVLLLKRVFNSTYKTPTYLPSFDTAMPFGANRPVSTSSAWLPS